MRCVLSPRLPPRCCTNYNTAHAFPQVIYATFGKILRIKKYRRLYNSVSSVLLGVKMTKFKQNLTDLLNSSGRTKADVEHATQISHPTILRMFDAEDPSIPDFDNIYRVVAYLGGSLDRIAGLSGVSADLVAGLEATIADKNEKIRLLEAHIVDLRHLVDEKQVSIDDKSDHIATLRSSLTEEKNDKRENANQLSRAQKINLRLLALIVILSLTLAAAIAVIVGYTVMFGNL